MIRTHNPADYGFTMLTVEENKFEISVRIDASQFWTEEERIALAKESEKAALAVVENFLATAPSYLRADPRELAHTMLFDVDLSDEQKTRLARRIAHSTARAIREAASENVELFSRGRRVGVLTGREPIERAPVRGPNS